MQKNKVILAMTNMQTLAQFEVSSYSGCIGIVENKYLAAIRLGGMKLFILDERTYRSYVRYDGTLLELERDLLKSNHNSTIFAGIFYTQKRGK